MNGSVRDDDRYFKQACDKEKTKHHPQVSVEGSVTDLAIVRLTSWKAMVRQLGCDECTSDMLRDLLIVRMIVEMQLEQRLTVRPPHLDP